MDNRDEIEQKVLSESRLLKRRLEEAGVQGVDKWWNEMVKEVHPVKDLYHYKNQFLAIMKEGQYALRLRMGGFDVQMKPYGKKRGQKEPDLQISLDGSCVDVEVTRFVRDKSAYDKLRAGGESDFIDRSTTRELPPSEVSQMRKDGTLDDKLEKGEICEIPRMVDIPWTSDKIYEKIERKLDQLHDDTDSILILFSDREFTERHDFKKLKEEWDLSELPAKLAAVIFSDGFIHIDGSTHESLINPHARMPADELERILEKIMRCLG